MKPVFKCDYCSKMGTEDEIREHEPVCMNNYNRKSCHTCVHKKISSKNGKYSYSCKSGKEIPEGQLFEFCDSYERKEKSDNPLASLFSDILGM